MTKVTYICRSAKKKVVTYFFFLKAFFGRFVTRGVKKHGKKNPGNLSGKGGREKNKKRSDVSK
jgi:hypothetical protein